MIPRWEEIHILYNYIYQRPSTSSGDTSVMRGLLINISHLPRCKIMKSRRIIQSGRTVCHHI